MRVKPRPDILEAEPCPFTHGPLCIHGILYPDGKPLVPSVTANSYCAAVHAVSDSVADCILYQRQEDEGWNESSPAILRNILFNF